MEKSRALTSLTPLLNRGAVVGDAVITAWFGITEVPITAVLINATYIYTYLSTAVNCAVLASMCSSTHITLYLLH